MVKTAMAKPQEAVKPPIEGCDAPSGAPASVKSQPSPEADPKDLSAWDPYEVWRTRVKGPEGSSP